MGGGFCGVQGDIAAEVAVRVHGQRRTGTAAVHIHRDDGVHGVGHTGEADRTVDARRTVHRRINVQRRRGIVGHKAQGLATCILCGLIPGKEREVCGAVRVAKALQPDLRRGICRQRRLLDHVVALANAELHRFAAVEQLQRYRSVARDRQLRLRVVGGKAVIGKRTAGSVRIIGFAAVLVVCLNAADSQLRRFRIGELDGVRRSVDTVGRHGLRHRRVIAQLGVVVLGAAILRLGVNRLDLRLVGGVFTRPKAGVLRYGAGRIAVLVDGLDLHLRPCAERIGQRAVRRFLKLVAVDQQVCVVRILVAVLIVEVQHEGVGFIARIIRLEADGELAVAAELQRWLCYGLRRLGVAQGDRILCLLDRLHGAGIQHRAEVVLAVLQQLVQVDAGLVKNRAAVDVINSNRRRLRAGVLVQRLAADQHAHAAQIVYRDGLAVDGFSRGRRAVAVLRQEELDGVARLGIGHAGRHRELIAVLRHRNAVQRRAPAHAQQRHIDVLVEGQRQGLIAAADQLIRHGDIHHLLGRAVHVTLLREIVERIRAGVRRVFGCDPLAVVVLLIRRQRVILRLGQLVEILYLDQRVGGIAFIVDPAHRYRIGRAGHIDAAETRAAVDQQLIGALGAAIDQLLTRVLRIVVRSRDIGDVLADAENRLLAGLLVRVYQIGKRLLLGRTVGADPEVDVVNSAAPEILQIDKDKRNDREAALDALKVHAEIRLCKAQATHDGHLLRDHHRRGDVGVKIKVAVLSLADEDGALAHEDAEVKDIHQNLRGDEGGGTPLYLELRQIDQRERNEPKLQLHAAGDLESRHFQQHINVANDCHAAHHSTQTHRHGYGDTASQLQRQRADVLAGHHAVDRIRQIAHRHADARHVQIRADLDAGDCLTLLGRVSGAGRHFRAAGLGKVLEREAVRHHHAVSNLFEGKANIEAAENRELKLAGNRENIVLFRRGEGTVGADQQRSACLHRASAGRDLVGRVRLGCVIALRIVLVANRLQNADILPNIKAAVGVHAVKAQRVKGDVVHRAIKDGEVDVAAHLQTIFVMVRRQAVLFQRELDAAGVVTILLRQAELVEVDVRFRNDLQRIALLAGQAVVVLSETGLRGGQVADVVDVGIVKAVSIVAEAILQEQRLRKSVEEVDVPLVVVEGVLCAADAGLAVTVNDPVVELGTAGTGHFLRIGLLKGFVVLKGVGKGFLCYRQVGSRVGHGAVDNGRLHGSIHQITAVLLLDRALDLEENFPVGPIAFGCPAQIVIERGNAVDLFLVRLELVLVAPNPHFVIRNAIPTLLRLVLDAVGIFQSARKVERLDYFLIVYEFACVQRLIEARHRQVAAGAQAGFLIPVDIDLLGADKAQPLLQLGVAGFVVVDLHRVLAHGDGRIVGCQVRLHRIRARIACLDPCAAPVVDVHDAVRAVLVHQGNVARIDEIALAGEHVIKIYVEVAIRIRVAGGILLGRALRVRAKVGQADGDDLFILKVCLLRRQRIGAGLLHLTDGGQQDEVRAGACGFVDRVGGVGSLACRGVLQRVAGHREHKLFRGRPRRAFRHNLIAENGHVARLKEVDVLIGAGFGLRVGRCLCIFGCAGTLFRLAVLINDLPVLCFHKAQTLFQRQCCRNRGMGELGLLGALHLHGDIKKAVAQICRLGVVGLKLALLVNEADLEFAVIEQNLAEAVDHAIALRSAAGNVVVVPEIGDSGVRRAIVICVGREVQVFVDIDLILGVRKVRPVADNDLIHQVAEVVRAGSGTIHRRKFVADVVEAIGVNAGRQRVCIAAAVAEHIIVLDLFAGQLRLNRYGGFLFRAVLIGGAVVRAHLRIQQDTGSHADLSARVVLHVVIHKHHTAGIRCGGGVEPDLLVNHDGLAAGIVQRQRPRRGHSLRSVVSSADDGRRQRGLQVVPAIELVTVAEDVFSPIGPVRNTERGKGGVILVKGECGVLVIFPQGLAIRGADGEAPVVFVHDDLDVFVGHRNGVLRRLFEVGRHDLHRQRAQQEQKAHANGYDSLI